jgi:hypothetical protein
MELMSIVYVLTNPAMPGLVKIGITGQDEDAAKRISQLYTSGVPVPFKLEFACRVPNASGVERALHTAFAPNRVNPRRELFEIEPDQAIAILRLLHVEDATNELASQPSDVDTQSLAAGEQLRRSRRPNMNFSEMGIPVGSTLICVDDGITTVTVMDAKKVRFGDDELSLTAATQRLLGLDYAVQPSPHWTFEGKSLHDIYNETYVEPE